MSVPHARSKLLRFAVFEVDCESGELRKQGRRIALHEQPFQALVLLMQHPGQVVTREQLKQTLWPADTFVDFDKSLNTAISKLREVLGDSAVSPRFIETLPRRGYRFLAPIEEVLETTAQSGPEQPVDQQTDEDARPSPHIGKSEPGSVEAERTRSRVRYIRYSLAALLAAVLLGWTIYHVSVAVERAATPSPTSFPSVAVLPIVNLGPPEQEYFADGLTDELIHRLTQISTLNVVARTSAFKFKGKSEDVRAIGRALGVSAILEGSIRMMSGQVRVAVRLVNTDNGFQIWSETYNRDPKDLSSIQENVAETVAMILKVKLAADPSQRVSNRYTENVEARNLYLQACHMQRTRSKEGFVKSIEYFQKAVSLDPQFAEAFAEMAYSYSALGSFYYVRPKDIMPKAKEVILRALELGPALSRAHSVLAYIHWAYDWDWQDAEREYKRAIELGPNDALIHLRYGNYLMQQERHVESMVHLRRAEQLDPLSPYTLGSVGGAFAHRGELTQAVEYMKKALDVEPAFLIAYTWLGRMYLARSQHEEAIATLEKGVSLSNRNPSAVAALAAAYAESGKKERAAELLKEVLNSNFHAPPAVEVACVYASLGEKDRAFDWLEAAYRERQGNLIWLKTTPGLNSLHSDPRWNPLIKKLNLKP